MPLALATASRLPEPDPDEALLVDALRARGADVSVLPWDGPAAAFAAMDLVVLRSTWNYIHRVDAFLAWADAIGDRLANPPAVVRWNSHKRYLVTAAAAGLPVVPTEIVPRGTHAALDELLERRGWEDAVFKPAVGAGSFATWRTGRGGREAEWRSLVADRDVLVQPYVASVDGWGERAIVCIDGAITHAVRKSPRFVGQDERVSPALPVEPDEHEVAERILAWAAARSPAPLLYARVDLARDADGRPMLMELELIEPSLFLAQHAPALRRFADAITRRLTSR